MNDNSVLRMTVEQLKDLLDRAYNSGQADSNFPNKWMEPWSMSRDKWIERKLECNHSLDGSEYFTCEVLGIHNYHSARMGSPVRWVDWDDNGMTPGEPDLPAGYERWYYEENKDLITEKRAKRKAKCK